MSKNKALTPKEIVQELDRYIVGQNQAKKAVAIALRNRWRRQRVDKKLKDEILPKNIIMMGPTGCGKTEIARRLAKLAHAPFIKVEATKFTEVGYVGRDVDSMVRDLVEVAVKMCREEAMFLVKVKAQKQAEERMLDLLLPKKEAAKAVPFDIRDLNHVEEPIKSEDDETREKMRTMLREGKFNDREVNIDVSKSHGPMPAMHMFGHAGSMEEMASQIQEALSGAFGKGAKRRQKVLVPEALELLELEEGQRLIDQEQVQKDAITLAEQSGIIFIDEIDKIASSDRGKGPDVSREGVQRDILPIVEGSQVSTKHGFVKTDHVLFIAAGAFHMSKPSDLIPELQGRFPIRVELDSLREEDFVRILTEPENSLAKQYKAMLFTENVTLDFVDSGIKSIAKVAFMVNSSQENIGARRLYTVMEKLLEEESFSASEISGTKVVVDQKLVEERLSPILKNEDLGRYIL